MNFGPTKKGPISNIGPKTLRAARDRPEKTLEHKNGRRIPAPEPPQCTAASMHAATVLHAVRATMRYVDTASRWLTTIVTPKSQFRINPSEHGNPGFTAGRGYNPAGGAPGGG
ncbi:dentin sialophosphoprotein-like [Dorcoceras hygrometricum]|uniref:Dentin sialophosphoprotein-like n=1 Tax=Dorcoceras hygrometricum TaxID=472368 RepID=A0A2Z7B6L0_9LAMI|nr:dentin sialophosphoprotein-like [Dorcoceras hygrometricum]